MPLRTRKSLSLTLLALSAGTLLSLASTTRSSAQGTAAPPVITSPDNTEYCAQGDLLTLDGTHFGLQGTRGYVVMGVPVADGKGGFAFQNYPLSIRSLIIHGEHFCNDPDGGWVTITVPYQDAAGNVTYRETQAASTAWLSTQIHVQFAAPPGAIPGSYLARRRPGAG